MLTYIFNKKFKKFLPQNRTVTLFYSFANLMMFNLIEDGWILISVSLFNLLQ